MQDAFYAVHLIFTNCKACFDCDILSKLAQILGNHSDAKNWKNLKLCNCGITDEGIEILHNKFIEYSEKAIYPSMILLRLE